MKFLGKVMLASVLTCSFALTVEAAERHMMQPLVPADQLEAAQALKSPIPSSTEIVEKGKVIYEGKGTCFNCHGMTGRGDAPGGASLDPSPRNFRRHGMWQHRTEGEIFWVIKHGSPGTGMIPFGGMLTDEAIWTVIQYEKSFSGGHSRRGMGPLGDMGKGRQGRGRHGGMGGMGQGEGECC